MIKIFPSLIAANLVNLEQAIRLLEPLCAGFHIDVMDFHFVPNLTLGPDFVNAIRKTTTRTLWVHLMVDNPEEYLPLLKLHADDIISIHYEHLSNIKLHKIVHALHEQKLKASIAINPTTPVEVTKHFFHTIDQVLLMSVQPGFSGQSLEPKTYERLQTLYDLREEHGLTFTLGVDGGINQKTLPTLVNTGADDLVLGSALFNTPHPADTLVLFNKLAIR